MSQENFDVVRRFEVCWACEVLDAALGCVRDGKILRAKMFQTKDEALEAVGR
jgi:hypothetical protein